MDEFFTRDETTTNCAKHEYLNNKSKANSKESIPRERQKTLVKDINPVSNDDEPNTMQYGKGSTDNDVIPYTFQRTGQKTFAKNVKRKLPTD